MIRENPHNIPVAAGEMAVPEQRHFLQQGALRLLNTLVLAFALIPWERRRRDIRETVGALNASDVS